MSRWIGAILGSLLVALGLFGVMHVLTLSQIQGVQDSSKEMGLDFIERPERRPDLPDQTEPPEKPELAEKPPRPQTPQTQRTRRAPRSMEQTRVQTDIAISSQFGEMPALGKVFKGPEGIGADLVQAQRLQARHRFRPRYPNSALRKRVEGYVKLVFTVTKEGKVVNAKVVEAKPEGVFEDAALKAIRRWEFKPPTEEGKAQSVRAVQTLQFQLGN